MFNTTMNSDLKNKNKQETKGKFSDCINSYHKFVTFNQKTSSYGK